MVKFKLLDSTKDIEKFKDLFCERISYEVPLGYFLRGDCYALIKNGEIIGGFCLVHDLPYKLRSIQQIPNPTPGSRWFRGFEEVGITNTNTAEFTGYFLNEKKHGLFFTWNLVKTILGHPARRYVYSYPVSQTRLGAYYAYGNPIRLHTGVPVHLQGHSGDMEEEHVEVLTRNGIIKIFLARTLRYILKK